MAKAATQHDPHPPLRLVPQMSTETVSPVAPVLPESLKPERATPKYADRSDVEMVAGEWSDDFLECRTYGHRWDPHTAVWNSEYHYWSVTQICHRCTCQRRQEMTNSGAVNSSYIAYADGYLSEGLGRIVGESRDVIRLAAVLRTFPTETLKGKAAKNSLPHSRKTREAAGLEEPREAQ